MPFNTGHGSCMMLESCHWLSKARKLSQIPNFDDPIITPRYNKRIISVPVYHINICGMCIALGEHTSFTWIRSYVPDFDGFITTAACKHCLFIGKPLDVLH